MAKSKVERDRDLEWAREGDLSDEDKANLSEEAKQALNLAELAGTLETERKAAVKARIESGVDNRLSEATQLYNGQQRDLDGESFDSNIKMPKLGNRVYMNMTRQITNDGSAQIGDTLFPSDDKNYGLRAIEIAPPPFDVANEPAVRRDGTEITDAEGNPITNAQAHMQRVAQLKERVKRMFKRVDGSLTAAKYPQKGRKLIFDAAHLGTGIIKGPIPNKVSRERWAKKKGGNWDLHPGKAHEADLKVVSPFDFFPDMSDVDVEGCEYIWERAFILPAKLEDGIDKNGFNKSVVKELLDAGVGPAQGNSADDTAHEAARSGSGISQKRSAGRYELWERWGPLKASEARAAGIDVPEGKSYVYAVVWTCNGKVLKAVKSPYKRSEHIYSVFNWDKDPMCIFGWGIPHLMDHPQRVYNTSWRIALDNSGLSVAPQVVIDPRQIKPAEGNANDYSMSGGKVWKKDGEQYSLETTGNKPFEVFEIPQNIGELFTLMDRALDDAYELTGVTRVDKKNQSLDNAPVTLGATQIVQNNNTVSRRALVRRYDDEITMGLVGRTYDFHMQFEEDHDDKGPAEVEPRGSTVLLSKEMVSQNLMQMYQLTGNGQAEGAKSLALLRAIENAMHFPEGSFIETETEEQQRIEATQDQEDPQLEMARRELEVSEAKIELQQSELQLKVDSEQWDRQYKVEQLNRKSEHDMAKLSSDERTELMRINANYATTELTAQVNLEVAGMHSQTQRDVAAGKLVSDDAKGELEGSIRATEVAIRDRDSRRADKELDAKLSGEITAGI